jgi:hypothetical protein
MSFDSFGDMNKAICKPIMPEFVFLRGHELLWWQGIN